MILNQCIEINKDGKQKWSISSENDLLYLMRKPRIGCKYENLEQNHIENVKQLKKMENQSKIEAWSIHVGISKIE